MISVVTLSYNQMPFLRAAIDSVLRQDISEFEYIVVDPGSRDGSRELIESYGKSISQVIFEPDRGAADGLNKGFARATGEIFGFLNADDILLPGALNRVAEFFASNPECDIAMGNGFVIDSEGRSLRHVRARDFTVQRFLHGGSRWLQQSTFFRRDAYLASPRFNIENRTCWDGELFVSMAQMGAVVGYVDADLAGFRIHGKSITGTGANQQAYRRDSRRIFLQICGRNWRMSDELLRLLYRIEGQLVRTGLWSRTPARDGNAV